MVSCELIGAARRVYSLEMAVAQLGWDLERGTLRQLGSTIGES